MAGSAIKIAILANAAGAVSGIQSTTRELGLLEGVGSRVGKLFRAGIVTGGLAAAAERHVQ